MGTKLANMHEIATCMVKVGAYTYLGTNKGNVYKMTNSTGAMSVADSVDGAIVSMQVDNLTLTYATDAGVVYTLTITNALPAGDSYSGLYITVTAAAPSNSYGMAGYFEADISGTQAGEFAYGFGAWINTATSTTVGAGKYLCAQDNGLYIAGSNTLTNAKLVFGMRAEIVGSAATGALIFPFSVNTNNQAITALFDVNNITDLGVTAVSKTTTATYLPIARDAAGNLRYVLLYS